MWPRLGTSEPDLIERCWALSGGLRPSMIRNPSSGDVFALAGVDGQMIATKLQHLVLERISAYQLVYRRSDVPAVRISHPATAHLTVVTKLRVVCPGTCPCRINWNPACRQLFEYGTIQSSVPGSAQRRMMPHRQLRRPLMFFIRYQRTDGLSKGSLCNPARPGFARSI